MPLRAVDNKSAPQQQPLLTDDALLPPLPSAVAARLSSATTAATNNGKPGVPDTGGSDRPATSSSLSSLPFEAVAGIMCPDPLLPVFRTAGSMAAHVLHAYTLGADARCARMLHEIHRGTDDDESGDDGGREDVGVAVEHLAQACEAYVKRYRKRMELLQKYSAETTSQRSSTAVLGARRVWCQRLQDYYDRPLSTNPGRVLFGVHLLLATLTLLSMTIQTIPSMSPQLVPDTNATWQGIEGAISVCFLLDVLVIFLANLLDPKRAVSDSLRIYFASFSNCLDLVALVLPTIDVFDDDDSSRSVANAFILFRLLRTFRLMRALRHFYAFEDLFETLKRSAFPLVGPIIAVLIFVVAFASMVYTMEAGSYREDTMRFMVRNEDCELKPRFALGLDFCAREESRFLSVFHTMWFSLIALLTIGYGDLVPKTFFGRATSIVCIVLGQLLMAMPIAIIGNKFTYVVATLKGERRAVLRFIEARSQNPEEHDEAARHLMPTAVVVTTGTTSTLSGAPFANEAPSSTAGRDETSSASGGPSEGQHLSPHMGVPVSQSTCDFVYPCVTEDASPDDACAAPLAPTTRTAMRTLPSVMLCRYLQFALKQRTLDLTQGDRLVAYAIERFLRSAATRYLAHVHHLLRQAEDDAAPATSDGDGSPMSGVAVEDTAGDGTLSPPAQPQLVLQLVHPDVGNTLSVDFQARLCVGEDAASDIPLRDATVRALAMSLYGEKSKRLAELRRTSAGRAVDAMSLSGRSTATGLGGGGGGNARLGPGKTQTQLALRQTYAIAPSHCLLHVVSSVHGRPEDSTVLVENAYEQVVSVVDNSAAVGGVGAVPVPPHGERHLNDGDTVWFSKVAHSVSTRITYGHAYRAGVLPV